MFRAVPARHSGCDDRIECLAAGAHDEFPYAPLWIGIPVGFKGSVAGIEVVVSVQHQVGSVLVEQLPKGLSGHALLGDAVGSAERGLVPVGGCARGMILLEILFQPCEFGGKPGARVRTAARLRLALYIERNKVPRAQIIGVPAISDSDWAVPARPFMRGFESARRLEVPRLSIRPRHGLGDEVRQAGSLARLATGVAYGARVRDRSRQRHTLTSVIGGIDQEAVVVGEVAVAGNAGLAMLVIKLVVAGRGPVEKFKSAIRQIERLLKVRISAYLVLQISEERDGVRLHSLNLIRSGLLGLPQRGAGVGGRVGGGADFIRSLTGRLHLAWLAGDVANHRQHGRFTRRCVRPRIVVVL